MTTEFALVPIAGQQILGALHDGAALVPMPQLCRKIGLEWEGQRQRIQRSELLSQGTFVIQVPSGTGGMQETLCLPVKLAYVFLVTLSLDRISDPTKREVIRALQVESFDAMFDYWKKGSAHNPRFARTNQRVMSVREVIATFDRLKASTDPMERRYLYGMLKENSIQFSLPLPELHEISAAENASRLHGENIVAFWQAYDALVAEHGTAAINRHRNPDRVAINLPDFQRRCRAAGIDLPFITDLRAALNADPRFVARAVVNTPESKSVNCWVFRAATDGDS